MERDSSGGSDVGRDIERDLGDEPPSAIRDAPPDYLAPIDASAPVSGHVPAPESSGSAMDSPEHDWARAQDLIYPALPTGRHAGPRSRPRSTATRSSGRAP